MQSAIETMPNVWRLRETQALLASLRAGRSNLVGHAARAAWRDGQPRGPWIELLADAINEHHAETGGTATPLVDFQKWLAEWGWDARRRQHGLLLLTAHRAKAWSSITWWSSTAGGTVRALEKTRTRPGRGATWP